MEILVAALIALAGIFILIATFMIIGLVIRVIRNIVKRIADEALAAPWKKSLQRSNPEGRKNRR